MCGFVGIFESCWVTSQGVTGGGGLGHLEEGFYFFLFYLHLDKLRSCASMMYKQLWKLKVCYDD